MKTKNEFLELALPDQKEIYGQFYDYFVSGEHDLKGLGLFGPVGVGKTNVFDDVIRHLFEREGGHFKQDIPPLMCEKYFKKISSREICAGYEEHGLSFFNAWMFRSIMIDDLGTESPDSVHFGSRRDAVSELLYSRYDKKLVTHFTTNLTALALKDRYGERITDRLREMVHQVYLEGESKRK